MKKFAILFAAVFASLQSAFVSAAEKAHDSLFRYMVKTGSIQCLDQIPSAADFNARRVTNPGQSEVYRQRLYDYNLYPTAGVSQIGFFTLPIGQGITSALGGTVGTTKTRSDTNMELAGQLPSGKSFLAESIEVLFKPGSVSTANTYTPNAISAFSAVNAAATFRSVDDVNQIYQSGLLEFTVLSKVYLSETPLMVFPPKAHLDISGAVATNSATTAAAGVTLAKAVGRPYYLRPEISIQPAVNFDVTIKWPAAVATPTGFNGRIGVILDGYFMRASQ